MFKQTAGSIFTQPMTRSHSYLQSLYNPSQQSQSYLQSFSKLLPIQQSSESSSIKQLSQPSSIKQLSQPSSDKNLSQTSTNQKLSQPSNNQQLSQTSTNQQLSQPSYNQQLSQPSYNQKLSQPSYNQKLSQPSYNQKLSQPSYNQQLSQPSYNQKLSQPSYNQPSYNQKLSQPSYNQPSSSQLYEPSSSQPLSNQLYKSSSSQPLSNQLYKSSSQKIFNKFSGLFSKKQTSSNIPPYKNISNKFNTNNKNNKNNENNENIIRISSWNIEDFTMITELLEDDLLISKLKYQHIILLQEWNNKEGQGNRFLDKLKKFKCVFVDRVAVLYNKKFFDSSKTIVYEIKLEFEPPTLIEQSYTSGRQKSNILTILYPKNGIKPLCVISFHLSAYIPKEHIGFHKKQLTQLILKAQKIIETNLNISDYDMIIGGDTNYRIPIKNLQSINLKNELINNRKLKEQLTNVCSNGRCNNKYTQSFSCVHEKTPNKQIISKFSYFFDESKLDLILTNLVVLYSVVIYLCDYSDHNMLSTEVRYNMN